MLSDKNAYKTLKMAINYFPFVSDFLSLVFLVARAVCEMWMSGISNFTISVTKHTNNISLSKTEKFQLNVLYFSQTLAFPLKIFCEKCHSKMATNGNFLRPYGILLYHVDVELMYLFDEIGTIVDVYFYLDSRLIAFYCIVSRIDFVT